MEIDICLWANRSNSYATMYDTKYVDIQSTNLEINLPLRDNSMF